MRNRIGLLLLVFCIAATPAIAEHGSIFKPVRPGSKVFIEDFLIGPYIADAKDDADYIISGTAREHYPSYARTVVLSDSKMYETSVVVKDAHSGDTVVTYSRDKRKASTEAKDFTKELGRALEVKQ